MYYVLYMDVFFVENLVMDYFLIRTALRLMKCSATHLRSLAGRGTGVRNDLFYSCLYEKISPFEYHTGFCGCYCAYGKVWLQNQR